MVLSQPALFNNYILSGMEIETASAPIGDRYLQLQDEFKNRYRKSFMDGNQKIKLIVGIGNDDPSQQVFETMNWVEAFAKNNKENIRFYPQRFDNQRHATANFLTLIRGLRIINQQ